MALLLAESFDNYTSDSSVYATGTRWLVSSMSNYFDFGSTAGFAGGGALGVIWNSPGGATRRLWTLFPDGARSEFRCAFWFRRYGASVPISEQGPILHFSSATGTAEGALGMDALGRLLAYPAGRDGNVADTFLAVGVTDYFDLAWHFIEVAVNFHASTGYYKVWADGNLEIDYAGNTIYSGGGLVYGCRIFTCRNGNVPRSFYLDDIMFFDDVENGDGFAGKLDGVRVLKTIRPTSDAAVAFTRSTGATNFSLVNAVALNMATYVESNVHGATDRYAFGAHGLADVSVRGVIVEANLYNPGAGSIGARMIAESGGTVAESAAIAVPAAAAPRQAAFGIRPGGGAWSLADVAAATYGLRVDAP